MFPKSQFTEEYVNFINRHFEVQNHLFILYTNKPFELPAELYDYSNVVDFDSKNLFYLYKLFLKADKIVFHNLSVNIDVLFMLFSHMRFIKKSIWLIWGSDLYCYRIPPKNAIEKFVEIMRRHIIKNLPVIASLADGDYMLAKKWYGATGQNIRLDYCEEYIISLLQKFREIPNDNGECTRIMVGNSATITNQHKEILDKLCKYKDENIEIVVPLSYGDAEYAKEITALGKKHFGEKFIPMLDYLSKDEYYELLNSVDIAIYNNDRQQATGNITALLYLGKKIYLRDDTSMWEEWVDKVGYQFNNIKDIERESFAELIYRDKEREEHNYELVKDFFCVENRIEEWKQAFGNSNA